MKGVRPSSRAGKSRPDLCTRNQEFLTLGSSAVHSVAGVLGSPTREGFQWNLARVSCGTRSPTRRWSPHPGCLPPLSLLDRRGTPRVVGSWILEAVNPSTTWKCRALVDKEIAVSPGGVPCLSSLPPACRLSPHFLQRPSRLSLRPDQKFKLLPRTSLATVEALGGPGRPTCPGAGGDPKLLVRIRGGFCITAWPSRSARPREGPRCTPRLPGLQGPLLPTPPTPSLSP